MFTNDNFIDIIENEIDKVKCSEKWRSEYMTLQDKYDEEREEGEDRLAKLLLQLHNDGRTDDITSAIADKVHRERLYHEFDM